MWKPDSVDAVLKGFTSLAARLDRIGERLEKATQCINEQKSQLEMQAKRNKHEADRAARVSAKLKELVG